MPILDHQQVLSSEIKGYVKEILEYKQKLQQTPEENSKYQAKTQFVKISSNAVKWLSTKDKIDLYKQFKIIEEAISTNILAFQTDEQNKIFVNADNHVSKILGDPNSDTNRSFILVNRTLITANKEAKDIDIINLQLTDLNLMEYLKDAADPTISPMNTEKIYAIPITPPFIDNVQLTSCEFYLNNNLSSGSNNAQIVTKQQIISELKKMYSGDIPSNQTGNLGILTDVKKKYYDALTDADANKKDALKRILKKTIKEKNTKSSTQYNIFKIKVKNKFEGEDVAPLPGDADNKPSGDPKAIYRVLDKYIVAPAKKKTPEKTIELKLTLEKFQKEIEYEFIIMVPSTTIDVSTKENSSESFFKLSRANFNNMQLLNILYKIIFKEQTVSFNQLKPDYNIDINVMIPQLDEAAKKSIITILQFKDEYARKHVLSSIDLSGKEKYDGGFYIFQKDGSITADNTNDNINGNVKNGLGYRPKVGITGISVDTQGKIGVLRRATVNLKAFDREQLEMVQTLYMRPGVFLFLEWGWSICPKQGSLDTSIVGPKQRSLDTLIRNNTYIDFFTTNTKKDIDIHEMIDVKKKESYGHYDTMFGVISNYTWSMNDAGEYDITINLTSNTTSLLALQMSRNSKATSDSSFRVNIFDKFRDYFDVLTKNNKNFTVLSNEYKNGKFDNDKIKLFSDTDEIPFIMFDNVKVASKNVGEKSVTSSPPKPKTKTVEDLIKWMNTNNTTSKPAYVDVTFKLSFIVNHPKINVLSKDVVANKNITPGEWEKSKSNKNLPASNFKLEPVFIFTSFAGDIYFNLKPEITNKTHTVRFPLIENLPFWGQTNLANEYMAIQDYDSNGLLNTVIDQISKVVPVFSDWRNLCTNGKINNTQIKKPFIQQYYDWLKAGIEKRKEIVTIDNKDYSAVNPRFSVNGLPNDLQIADESFEIQKFNDTFYNGLIEVYTSAYNIFSDTIYMYGDNTPIHFTTYDMLIKSIQVKGISNDAYQSIINNPRLTNTIKESIYINPKAYYNCSRLNFIQKRKDTINIKWETQTIDVLKNGSQKEKITYKDIGEYPVNNVNNSYEEVNQTSESTGGSAGGSVTAQQNLESKITKSGGMKPFYISLKYLFVLLNDALSNKNTASGISHPTGSTAQINYEDYINKLTDPTNDKMIAKLKKLIIDIKKEDNDYVKITDNNEKIKYLNNILRSEISGYNQEVANIKSSLFAGINLTSPVCTRKIGDLMSIQQDNVVFLTKKIVENIFKSKKNNPSPNELQQNLTKLSVDNVDNVDGVDKTGLTYNNILLSTFVSCKFINNSIEQSSTLDAFIKSIFSEIFNASGNIIDLAMSESESKNSKSPELIKIYDRVGESVTQLNTYKPFIFSTLSNLSIMKSLTFSSKLPSSFQRVAFVAASPIAGSSNNENIVNKTLNRLSGNYVNNPTKFKFFNGVLHGDEEDSGEEIRSANNETLKGLLETPLDYSLVLENKNFPAFYSNYISNKYIMDSKQSDRDKFEDAVRTGTLDEKFLIPPVGLELSFTIDGTSGLQWGNLFTIDYLPNGLNNAVFQINKLTDDIKEDGWVTNISGILRKLG